MASNSHVEAQASTLPLADSTMIDDNDEMLFGDDTELASLSLPLASGQPYNRSLTDPGSKQQKLSVFRARRMRTNPLIQGSTVQGSAEAIAKATFSTITQNMEQHGLRISHLWQHNFHWLLPKSGATQQQLKIFCALRDHPLIVPNGDLVRILDLEQSTESSPPTPLGTHFYVRSFELTHYQLTKVIKFMAKRDVLLSEAGHWEYEAPAPKTSSSRGKKRHHSYEDELDDNDDVQPSKKAKKAGKGRDAGKRSAANLVARKG
jgi:hypothetical protein